LEHLIVTFTNNKRSFIYVGTYPYKG